MLFLTFGRNRASARAFRRIFSLWSERGVNEGDASDTDTQMHSHIHTYIHTYIRIARGHSTEHTLHTNKQLHCHPRLKSRARQKTFDRMQHESNQKRTHA